MLPVRVDLITDMAADVVLHWGVTKPGSKDWVLPPEELWPEKTLASVGCITSLGGVFLAGGDDIQGRGGSALHCTPSFIPHPHPASPL